MFKSHKILCFCLILLALFGFTAQAQAETEEFVLPVGAVGGAPDPDPFVWTANAETSVSALAWADSKVLEFGPGKLGFFIDESQGTTPYFGVLPDTGLNPISGTEFSGVANADAVDIDLAEATRFGGIRVSLGGQDNAPGTWFLKWLTFPTVRGGDATGNQPPIANAGGPHQAIRSTERLVVISPSTAPNQETWMAALWPTSGTSVMETSATERLRATGTRLSASPPTTHSYAAAGTYYVTLTVTDDSGTTNTDSTVTNISSRSGGGGSDSGCFINTLTR